MKKIFTVLALAVLCSSSLFVPAKLEASSVVLSQLSEITAQEKILVCCKLAEDKVLQFETAVAMLTVWGFDDH